MNAGQRRNRPAVALAMGVAFAFVCSVFGSACGAQKSGDVGSNVTITVAAASDLRPAFEELGAAFTESSGTQVTFTFGSSGQLREQIINGAPFDLFASANASFVDEVIASGRGVADTKADYSFGRIVLWAAPGLPLPDRIEDLSDPTFRRIVIANPEHAPYGAAALQALQAAGIADDVDDRLVFGENVSDAFAIAKSGNADIGIVALSLAISDGSEYATIPAGLHEPLRQTLVVTSNGERGQAAAAFAAFIAGSTGRATMARYGFTLPAEQASADSVPSASAGAGTTAAVSE